jgi:hypothetical protein
MRKSLTLVSLLTFSLGVVLAVAPIHMESAVAAPPNSLPESLGTVQTVHCGNLACQFQAGDQWYGIQPNATDTMVQIFQKVAADQIVSGAFWAHGAVSGVLTGNKISCDTEICGRSGTALEVQDITAGSPATTP